MKEEQPCSTPCSAAANARPPAKKSPKLAPTGWATMDVVYDVGKRPVQILRRQGAACTPYVDEAIATLRTRGFFRARPDLVARLRETKQVLLASDDVWELLDFVEARACRELDGVA